MQTMLAVILISTSSSNKRPHINITNHTNSSGTRNIHSCGYLSAEKNNGTEHYIKRHRFNGKFIEMQQKYLQIQYNSPTELNKNCCPSFPGQNKHVLLRFDSQGHIQSARKQANDTKSENQNGYCQQLLIFCWKIRKCIEQMKSQVARKSRGAKNHR